MVCGRAVICKTAHKLQRHRSDDPAARMVPGRFIASDLPRLRAKAVERRRVVGQDAPAQRQLSPETRFDYGFTTDPTSNA